MVVDPIFYYYLNLEYQYSLLLQFFQTIDFQLFLKSNHIVVHLKNEPTKIIYSLLAISISKKYFISNSINVSNTPF